MLGLCLSHAWKNGKFGLVDVAFYYLFLAFCLCNQAARVREGDKRLTLGPLDGRYLLRRDRLNEVRIEYVFGQALIMVQQVLKVLQPVTVNNQALLLAVFSDVEELL